MQLYPELTLQIVPGVYVNYVINPNDNEKYNFRPIQFFLSLFCAPIAIPRDPPPPHIGENIYKIYIPRYAFNQTRTYYVQTIQNLPIIRGAYSVHCYQPASLSWYSYKMVLHVQKVLTVFKQVENGQDFLYIQQLNNRCAHVE